MARFRVKNLMVDVVSASAAKLTPQICFFPTKACRYLTLNCPHNTHIWCVHGNTFDCPILTRNCFLTDDGCGLNYSTCLDTRWFVIDVERLVINPADIKSVQKQVGELLKGVEVRADEVARDMAPKTLEQAALLEESFNEALAEIKRLKKELG